MKHVISYAYLSLTDDELDDTELDEEEQLVDFDELERIYIFSRDGDITELSKGATVLDFAYYVHTQVGNRAQAARVSQLLCAIDLSTQNR